MTAAVDINLTALDALDRLAAEFERSNPRFEGARRWLAYQRELRTKRRDFILARTPTGLWRVGFIGAFVDVAFRSNGLDFIQLAIIQQGAPVRVDAPTDNATEQKKSRVRLLSEELRLRNLVAHYCH